MVVPNYLHYAEFRKLTEQRDAARYFAYDHPTVSLRQDHASGVIQQGAWFDSIDVDRPDEEMGDSANPRVHVGSLVAGEKLMSDPRHPEQQRLSIAFDDAIAVDMESVGVARAIHDYRRDPDYNPRFLVVRGISDLLTPVDNSGGDETTARVVETNNEERALWKPYAAATAAAFAAALVEDICQ